MLRALLTWSGIAAALAAAVLSASALWPLQAAEPQAASHVVEIRGFKFQPDKLDVSIGDTIVWINRDIVPHTVTADGTSWDSKTITKGAKWETVVKAGMREMYLCRFHPTMKGSIRIVPK